MIEHTLLRIAPFLVPPLLFGTVVAGILSAFIPAGGILPPNMQAPTLNPLLRFRQANGAFVSRSAPNIRHLRRRMPKGNPIGRMSLATPIGLLPMSVL